GGVGWRGAWSRSWDRGGGGRLGVGAVDALAIADRPRERRGGERRGALARLCPAHPVGDREERRLADERVLVAPPLPAGVGVAEAPQRAGHRSNRRSVWPTRTT